MFENIAILPFRKKFLAICSFIVLVCLFEFVLYGFFKHEYNNRKNEYLTTLSYEWEEEYQSLLYEYKTVSDTVMNGLYTDSRLKNILKNANATADFKKANSEIVDTYKGLKLANEASSIIRIFQIHDKNGNVLIRFQKPTAYGDNVLAYLQVVSATHKNRTAAQGFEGGKYFNAYRFVYPIFDNDVFLGSVQLGFEEKAVNTQLERNFKINAYMAIDSNKNMLADGEIATSPLSSKNKKLIHHAGAYSKDTVRLIGEIFKGKQNEIDEFVASKGRFVLSESADNKYYVAIIKPFMDFENKNTGYLVLYSEDTNIPLLNRDYYISLLLGMALVLVLCVALAEIFMRYYGARVELFANKQRLKLAIEAGGVGIWDWDIKSNRLIWDDKMFELYGVNRKDFSGAYDAWISGLHPDDREFQNQLSVDARAGIKPFDTEFRVIHPDGSVHYLKATAHIARDKNGDAVRMTGTNWDITERKRFEESLERERNFVNTVLDTVNAVVAVIDKNGSMVRFNKYAEDFTGYSADDVRRPMFWRNFLRREQHNGVAEVFDMARSGNIKPRYENHWVSKSGEDRLFDWSNSVIRDASGEMTHLVTIGFDITKRKELEDELQSINVHLNELVQQEIQKRIEQEKILLQQSKMAMMGEMIGAIAHQWRQPLNALAISIQDAHIAYKYNEIDDKYMDDFKVRNMSIIHKMSDTIDDFRNFFKPVKEKEDFSVSMAVQETLNIISSQLKSHDIKTVFDKMDDCKINGYQNELEQAILIILSNAQDALAENKVSEPLITISVECFDNFVLLSIQDNGGGVPENIADRIFEPYFTTKEQGKGTGIGLYMAKEIAERQMGGKISVQNVHGGARFTIEVAKAKA